MTTRRSYSGNAPRTAIAAAGITDSTTTFDVVSGSGYPTSNFFIVVDRGLSTEEKMLVSTRSGSTIVVSRGADGTTAQAHGVGATVEHCYTALDADEANAHTSDTVDDHLQYIRTAGNRAFTGLAAVAAAPVAVVPGASNAEGTALTLARSNHEHEFPPFGVGVAAVGTASSPGVADELARVDHVHAAPPPGATVVANAAALAAFTPAAGAVAYQSDTGLMYLRHSSAWRVMAGQRLASVAMAGDSPTLLNNAATTWLGAQIPGLTFVMPALLTGRRVEVRLDGRLVVDPFSGQQLGNGFSTRAQFHLRSASALSGGTTTVGIAARTVNVSLFSSDEELIPMPNLVLAFDNSQIAAGTNVFLEFGANIAAMVGDQIVVRVQDGNMYATVV